jgi:hypothetical protein
MLYHTDQRFAKYRITNSNNLLECWDTLWFLEWNRGFPLFIKKKKRPKTRQTEKKLDLQMPISTIFRTAAVTSLRCALGRPPEMPPATRPSVMASQRPPFRRRIREDACSTRTAAKETGEQRRPDSAAKPQTTKQLPASPPPSRPSGRRHLAGVQHLQTPFAKVRERDPVRPARRSRAHGCTRAPASKPAASPWSVQPRLSHGRRWDAGGRSAAVVEDQRKWRQGETGAAERGYGREGGAGGDATGAGRSGGSVRLGFCRWIRGKCGVGFRWVVLFWLE